MVDNFEPQNLKRFAQTLIPPPVIAKPPNSRGPKWKGTPTVTVQSTIGHIYQGP